MAKPIPTPIPTFAHIRIDMIVRTRERLIKTSCDLAACARAREPQGGDVAQDWKSTKQFETFICVSCFLGCDALLEQREAASCRTRMVSKKPRAKDDRGSRTQTVSEKLACKLQV